jgi:hypothetical protein
MTMVHETIDTDEAIRLFGDLMSASRRMRVLCLVGEEKMGKTHLLTKVFPVLAREPHVRSAILDLRNEADTIADLLHQACGQLDPDRFQHYYAAHDQYTDHGSFIIRDIPMILSILVIHGRESVEAMRSRNRRLTTQFVKDLSALDDVPLLLLFDSVERASPWKQSWLMDSLLPQLSSWGHIKVVVASCSPPTIHGSYAADCRTHRLAPVTDDTAYITYCQQLRATLGEQSIRDFALACKYTPGHFAELVLPAFGPGR